VTATAGKVKVKVPYEHDPADLSTIYLGVTAGDKPAVWIPAFRDIDRTGKRPLRVVVAHFPPQNRTVKVWVRDRDGARPSHTQMV
jgi:hypothetical protein